MYTVIIEYIEMSSSILGVLALRDQIHTKNIRWRNKYPKISTNDEKELANFVALWFKSYYPVNGGNTMVDASKMTLV